MVAYMTNDRPAERFRIAGSCGSDLFPARRENVTRIDLGQRACRCYSRQSSEQNLIRAPGSSVANLCDEGTNKASSRSLSRASSLVRREDRPTILRLIACRCAAGIHDRSELSFLYLCSVE
jgi:hypothetical protein